MLEQRPIVKKGLYGAGAFLFVFASAMGGTAFMLSGGFGSGQHAPADPPAYQIAANDTWQDPAAAAPAAPEHPAITAASLQAPAPAIQPLAAPDDANVVSTTPSAPAAELSGGDAANAAPPIAPIPTAPAKPDGT